MTPRVLAMGDAATISLTRAGLGVARVDADDSERIAVWAATLRAALWALTDAGATPVYTLRLLNLARHLAGPALGPGQDASPPDDDPEYGVEPPVTLRDILDELAALGDVARLAGGSWLPAPLRAVPLQHVDRWLLVGGLPTMLLPHDVRSKVQHRGVARLLPAPVALAASGLRVQTEAAWLQAPDDDIAAWADRILRETPLEPPSDDLAARNLALYRPNRASAGAWQHQRWWPFGPGGNVSRGRFLGRIATRMGRQYLVVDLHDGHVRAAGAVSGETIDVRRMLYALDRLANRPTRIARFAGPVSVVYELRSELPAAELRLLRALGGQLTVPSDGNYYPRCWTVWPNLAPRMDRAIQALGVKVDHRGL